MKNISQRCDELRYASSPHTILDEGRKGWRKEKKHTKNDKTHCECTPLEYQVKKDGSHLSPTKCMTRVSWRLDLLRDKQIKWMLPSSPITQLSNSISFLLHWVFFFSFLARRGFPATHTHFQEWHVIHDGPKFSMNLTTSKLYIACY